MKGFFSTGPRREEEGGGAAEKMGSTISGSARRGETASRDVALRRRHTHYVWRSDGVHESARVLVRDTLLSPPSLRASEQNLSNDAKLQARRELHNLRPPIYPSFDLSPPLPHLPPGWC